MQIMSVLKESPKIDLWAVFQACTEFSTLAGSNNKTDMFPPLPWTPDMRAQYCQEKWGVTQRPGWAVTQLWGKGWF